MTQTTDAPHAHARTRAGLAAILAIAVALSGSAAAAERRPVDRILIEKAAHRMTLFRGGKPVRSYSVALGKPGGPKQRQGDERTPEGLYVVAVRQARSRFHRALRISYPNADDRARARAAGVKPGGDIMIHGIPEELDWLEELHRLYDWTKGCVALTNREIDEIWPLVRVGTPVEIRP